MKSPPYFRENQVEQLFTFKEDLERGIIFILFLNIILSDCNMPGEPGVSASFKINLKTMTPLFKN